MLLHLSWISDPWYQVAFVLTTGINSAYVLGYSGSIMVPLGWVAGATGLLLAAAMSLYANFLVARLHEVGGKRHIRYRDLSGYIYGNHNNLFHSFCVDSKSYHNYFHDSVFDVEIVVECPIYFCMQVI